MDLVSVLVVFLSTLLAFGAAIYAYGVANLEEIKDNWVQYRCNPLYMPLADLVGSDIFTNFTNCTLQATHNYAGVALDPIYKNFAILTDTVNIIMNSMNDMRAAITGASSGFLTIIQTTFAKIQNTMSTSVQLFGHVRTIISRMMATMAIMMNIVNTGVQTGESIQNGPIGKAADFFCFHPDTLIKLSGNKTCKLSEITPGTKLYDGQLVVSTLKFVGGCPMFSIGGVQVSGNHKILHEMDWIRVETHPDALPTEPCEFVYCLNTTSHRILAGDHIFKDYEETSNPEILREFFTRVQMAYGPRDTTSAKIQNPARYTYTGVLPTTLVKRESGEMSPAMDIRIGDQLALGGLVKGVIHHRVRGQTVYATRALAPGTWVLDEDGEGVFPSLVVSDNNELHDYVQFVTEKCRYSLGDMVILDDHEVDDDEIHTWRDSEVQKEMI
uniref:Hedgehog/Intein (Hint) domain-containing protein n=1 Tax=viral metagenome TaxID=1070528 RepID=A0A6C0CJH6_9ZZZZ